MKKQSTAKAGSLYLFASIFNRGLGFLTIPVFTRLLSTSDYGIVTTYSAWAAILTAIIGMQLNCGIRLSRGTDCRIKIEKHKELSTVFTFTLLIAAFMFTLIAICCLLFPVNANFALIAMCFLEGLFTALITDYTYYQMMEYKYIGRVFLMVLPNLLAAVLSVGFIYIMTAEKYMGRIISLFGMHAIIGLVVCFLVFSHAKPQIDRTYIKWTLKVSLPLILHGVALNILAQADRTMISVLRDTSETGIYSLIYSFSMIATVITTGLEGIWIPWFTQKMNESRYGEVNCVSKDYIHLMTYAMTGLILISPEILKLLAPSAYWEGIVLIPPLVISNFVIFAYTMYVNVEYYYEKTLFITENTIIAAGLNIVLNGLFIPKFGYMAAAYTTLFCYIVSFVIHTKYARKLNHEVLPLCQYVTPIIHVTASTVLFYIFIETVVFRWLLTVIYVAAMILAERKRMGALLPALSTKFRFFR